MKLIIAYWKNAGDRKYTMHDASKTNTGNVFNLIDELCCPYDAEVRLVDIIASYIDEDNFQEFLEWHFLNSYEKIYKFKPLYNYID